MNSDKKVDLIFYGIDNNDSDISTSFKYISSEGKPSGLKKLGTIGDIPFYGDFDGDGVTDIGVFRHLTRGTKWEIISNKSMLNLDRLLGEHGDLPVPGDYDGDGKDDLVVYRPKNSGFYGALSSKFKKLEVHFGVTGDIPVPGDYDGDGRHDIAVYRKQSGAWTFRPSKSDIPTQKYLGGPKFFPVPADYDGDGKADLAVWSPENNDVIAILSSSNKKVEIKNKFVGSNLFPASFDLNVDGKSEFALWDDDIKKLQVLDVLNNKIETIEISAEEKLTPVKYPLIGRFIKRDIPSSIYKDGIVSLMSWNKKDYLNDLGGDFDGDNKSDETIVDELNKSINVIFSSNNLQKNYKIDSEGKVVIGDFDGDGKTDLGVVDLKNRALSFRSSATTAIKNVILPKRVEGQPFAFDVDLDLKSDIIVFNEELKSFVTFSSSNEYSYNEVRYMEEEDN